MKAFNLLFPILTILTGLAAPLLLATSLTSTVVATPQQVLALARLEQTSPQRQLASIQLTIVRPLATR